MTKAKILFFITKGNFGGAQRYVYDLATNAPPQFEAVVACGNQDGTSLKDKLGGKSVRTIDIENSGREINVNNDFAVLRQLIKIIKKEKPDIVHFNSSKIGFLGAMVVLYFKILKLFRILNFEFQAVYTSHGWAFNEEDRGFFWKIAYWLSYYFTLIVMDITIAVSEKTKKNISVLPFIGGKIKVIYNGIAKFKPKTKKEARALLAGESGKKIILLSIGELHRSKGFDISLSAIARLNHDLRSKVLYCIIGEGEEGEKLIQMSKEMDIENEVKFFGFIPDAKELLSGADYLIFPSRNENLPYTILEAGVVGLPIIATSVGGIPEIIDDMEDGILVYPRNPRELTEAVTYLIENTDKVKMFKEKIKEKIASKFSLEKMVSQTYSIYESFLPKT